MSCITEILKLKGDKEVLVPEGEWIAVEGGIMAKIILPPIIIIN
jgi:hypothetical protein